MKDLQEFFSILNNNVVYVVLRNYENFEHGFLNEDHPDIDILCSSRKQIMGVIRMQSRTRDLNDRIHRMIEIGGRKVSIDLREVGDGYYCTEWESNMLKHRVLKNNSFYTLNPKDYYYSLLYHALIHKKQLSVDYKDRLTRMGNSLGICSEYATSLNTLQEYMRSQKYWYTYPEFLGGIANFKYVDKDLVKHNTFQEIRRYIFRLKRAFRNLIA